MFSQAQCQVYRVTERSLGRLRRDRANSCPDIVQQLNRDFDHFSNSNWRYMTAHERFFLDPYYPKNHQQTQTEITPTLQVKDTGAQYSSPSDSSDSSSSDSDSYIEGTENITVAKHYLHRHSVSSEDLYTNPMPPNKRFRTSTSDPTERRPEKEPSLIAMDNFAAMQTKAKQLVQIYKPAHDSPMASAAILVHTAGNTPTKSKSAQPKSNQHQLAPINQPQDNPNTGETEYNGGQRGRGRRGDRSSRGHGNRGNSDNWYDNQDRGAGRSQGQWDFQYNRG